MFGFNPTPLFLPLQACELDELSALAIQNLFPALSDHGRIEFKAPVSVGALRILAAQTRIRELQMSGLSPQLDMHGLVSFRSLESLVLIAFGDGTVNLEPLCAGMPSAGPQLQLTKVLLVAFMAGRKCDVVGLDSCLAHHPIQELHLENVCFRPSLAPSMRLASSTLRVMRINLNLTYPELSAPLFPVLRVLQIDTLNLGPISGMSTAQESVQRCKRLAMSISGFPCVHFVGTGESEAFKISCDDDCRAPNQWSQAELIELLKGLIPLCLALGGLRSVSLAGNVGFGAVRIIACLFPNVESLELWLDREAEEGVLFEAVCTMPNLKQLILSVSEPPADVITALMRKAFVLELMAASNECYGKLDCVRRCWENMRQHMPDQCTATLVVENGLRCL